MVIVSYMQQWTDTNRIYLKTLHLTPYNFYQRSVNLLLLTCVQQINFLTFLKSDPKDGKLYSSGSVCGLLEWCLCSCTLCIHGV